eukprot:3940430-Heterocapsa_arctica.AAC.1
MRAFSLDSTPTCHFGFPSYWPSASGKDAHESPEGTLDPPPGSSLLGERKPLRLCHLVALGSPPFFLR